MLNLHQGILVFYYPDIRNLFNLKLFVDTDADIRLARLKLKYDIVTFVRYNIVYMNYRRVMRDIEERGRDLETVLHQYTSLVKPAFEEFCIPTKKYADVIIPRGVENTVAIDLIKQHIQDLIFRSAGVNKTESNCHERSRSNSDSTNTSR